MSAASLVAQLAAAGTPPELLAAVAERLFAGQTAQAVVDARRAKDRDRKRSPSEEIHGTPRNSRNGAEIRDTPPDSSPKDTQTPSLPPVDVSEAEASSHQPRPWALPAGVSLQVWTDFLGNRKRKRLGTSATAWKHFQDDLKRVASQTGIPPPQLIERCTAKGWGAIYDPREARDDQRTNGMGRNQPSSDGLSPTSRAALAVFGAGQQRGVSQ